MTDPRPDVLGALVVPLWDRFDEANRAVLRPHLANIVDQLDAARPANVTPGTDSDRLSGGDGCYPDAVEACTNPGHARVPDRSQWVDDQQRVRAFAAWRSDLTHGVGHVKAYSRGPQVFIERDNGETFWWRADLCEVVTPAPAPPAVGDKVADYAAAKMLPLGTLIEATSGVRGFVTTTEQLGVTVEWAARAGEAGQRWPARIVDIAGAAT